MQFRSLLSEEEIMTSDLLSELPKLAAARQKENKRFFRQLKKNTPKHLDTVLTELDTEAFQQIDCLSCANCCRTTGPLFTNADINRIARVLRMKPRNFIESYLRVDEDGDHVLQRLPCPFLHTDNTCSIYEHRPKACREYPHTTQRKFHNYASLHLKNVAICPAAYRVVERLKERVDF